MLLVMYCTVLYCIVLNCTVLYCTVPVDEADQAGEQLGVEGDGQPLDVVLHQGAARVCAARYHHAQVKCQGGRFI